VALARALQQRGFRLVTGGTENHLLLVNVRPLGMDGLAVERALERAGILANRNAITGDASPFRPSGLRMGTPAITTRGMREGDMRTLADLIADVLLKRRPQSATRRDVLRLAKRFPLP
jgi:glycine hydroxymethyltransferase